jgi:hypothetical protein
MFVCAVYMFGCPHAGHKPRPSHPLPVDYSYDIWYRD